MVIAIALSLACASPVASSSMPQPDSAPGRVAPIAIEAPQFIALSVPDLAASARWYRELFGLTVSFEAASPDSSVRVMALRSPTLLVELVQKRGAKSLEQYAGAPTAPDLAYGIVKIGFFVRDLDATIAALRAYGATIEGTWLQRPANADASWQRNILVRDVSGTYVQFFESPRR